MNYLIGIECEEFRRGCAKTCNLMKNQYLFVCSLLIVINVILSGLKPIRITFYDKCVGN